MKQIPKDNWYFTAFTWCGVTKEGVRKYPVSYGDNGRAWAMTEKISKCLDFRSPQHIRKMIEAELKYDVFFKHTYPLIELVEIKIYPTKYFDLRDAAKKHRIKKVNSSMNSEEIQEILKAYGWSPLPDEETVIEVKRDNGEFYAEIINYKTQALNKIEKIKVNYSVFEGDTYLMKTYKDLNLLCDHIKDARRLGWLWDEETKSFPDWSENIYLPCFAVITSDNARVYSIKEVKQIIANANEMLKIIDKLEATK